MKRIKLLDWIIEYVASMVEPYGYRFVGKDKDGFPFPLHVFERVDGEMIYKQIVRFTQPNYIGYSSKVRICNEDISLLVKKIANRSGSSFNSYMTKHIENFFLCEIDLETYTHPVNKDAIKQGFQWNYMKLNSKYIMVTSKDATMIDVERIAKDIVSVYFKPVAKEIIGETNTLAKIDRIVNGYFELGEDIQKWPNYGIFRGFLHQLSSSVILANYLDKSNKREITASCLNLSKECAGSGSVDYDLLILAVNYFYGNSLLQS